MKINTSPRGFEVLDHAQYGSLASQSSAIGDYPDSLQRPGSSYLWIGEDHLTREEVAELAAHLQASSAIGDYPDLDREEVAQLAAHLQAWVKTGSFVIAQADE